MPEIRRIALTVLALLMTLVGLGMTSTAAAAPTVPNQAAYDAPALSNVLATSHVEHDSPVGTHRACRPLTVDDEAHGALTRLSAAVTPSYTVYDQLVRPKHSVSTTGTTHGHAEVLDGDLSSLQRVNVAANGGIKALPSGPKTTAQWGADTYRHGGLMSTIEHINYRHGYGSGFSGVNRYARGTSAWDIKGFVDYVLRNGTVTDRGIVGNVGRTIGTDRAGNPVSGLEIIVRDGMIKTAYPVGVP